MKNLIIGLGSGRCGTTSLAHLLDSQPDASFIHEGTFSGEKYNHFLLPWETDHSRLIEWKDKVEGLRGSFVGDVGFYFLPYVEEIINRFPDTKFICMKREKEEVVSSFMKKTRGRNHWSLRPSVFEIKDPVWDPCFPKILEKKRAAIRLYWDYYYQKAEILQKKFPDNFRIFPTYFLGYEGGVNIILNFAGFPKGDYVIVPKHENKIVFKDQISSMLTFPKNIIKKLV